MNRQMCSIVLCGALAATASAQSPDRPSFERGGPAGVAPVGNPVDRNASGPALNPMFAAIDADGDGVITTKELRKAVAVLKKMDADRDGNITLAEVNAQVMPAGAGGPGVARGGQSGGRNNFGGPAGFAGRDGFEQGAISQQLMQNDRNGDGRLTPDEVPPQLRGSLRGGDTNGDGTIDAQELQALTQRMSERFRGGRPLPPGFDPRAGAGQQGQRDQ